jgi:uncharacterized membrane protein YraQ (UPF0718 family)
VHDFIETFLIVFIAGMLVAIAIGIWHRSRVDRAREAARQFIGKQASAFARRRAQLLYVDAYGVEQTAKWEKEKKHIIAKVIPDHLLKSGTHNLQSWRRLLR